MSRSKVLRIDRQAVDEAIHLAHEGKLNPKNAWDVRILDDLDNTVDVYMNEHEAADAYTQFTKAASIVESGAKVWAHRVESTFLLTTRMQQKLMRSDWVDKNEPHEGIAAAENAVSKASQQAKSLLHFATENNDNRVKQSSPAIVQTNAEIALMNKTTQRSLVGEGNTVTQNNKSSFFEIDPLFKATASKLGGIGSQYNSGFLLNNTHVGPYGNILLGVEQVTKESKRCFMWPVDSYGIDSQKHLIQHLFDVGVEGTIFQGKDNDDHFDSSHGNDSAYINIEDSPTHDNRSEIIRQEGDHRTPADTPLVNRLSTTSVLNGISTFYDPDWIPIEPDVRQPVKQGSILEQMRKDTSMSIPLNSLNMDKPEQDKKVNSTRKRVRFQFEDVSLSWVNCDDRNYYEEKKQQSEISGPLNFVSTVGKEFLVPEHRRKTNKSDAVSHIFHNMLDNDYALSVASAKGIVMPLQGTTMNMYLKSFNNVNCYLQPFCSKEPHWNWLSKRKNACTASSNAYGDVFSAQENPVEIGDLIQSDDDDFSLYSANFDDAMGSVETSLVLHNTNTQITELEDDSKLARECVASLVPEPKSVMPVLKIHSITKPSVIDVSKLRNVMWKYIDHSIQRLAEKSSLNCNEAVAFSEIVYTMIRNKEIHQISHDGTLSPAFFYFALLFLANEKDLRLDQCENLDDILIYVK